MSAQHLEILETTVQKTHQWIDALAEEAHMDTHTAYQVLRAVLHTLRDRLPAQEVAHFGAQLPILVRGIFYEGWTPADAPIRLNREAFLQRISTEVSCSRIIDPVAATENVLNVMNHFLGAGELDKIAGILPPELRSMFPKGPILNH